MSKRFLFIVISLFVALPAVLYAYNGGGMSSMPGMGGFVDEVHLQTKTVGKVSFSHSFHGANCGQCHPKVFKKKNNSNHATMKQMERGRSCGACHNGKKAFSVKKNCAKCHTDARDILFKDEENGNVTFPHSVHLEMFSCDECHPDLFKARRGANKTTMEAMESGESCGACHDGDAAFGVADDCESCHQM